MDNLIQAIKDAGGRCYLIGGAVIDSIMGRTPKDWDIEVYGLSMSQLEEVLLNNSFQANKVGASFGIIKVTLEDCDVDLSIPRRENRIGVKHQDFEVILDPEMSPKEAGRRRDLTINSMYKDLETGELVDPYGGKQDLEEGRIKATDPKTFVEDPLRVLRIMQLLPRKGKFVDLRTEVLCQSIVDEFDSIAKERVFEEFNKLLLKAEKPSLGLQFLVDCGWICHFPELSALVGCPQNPEHHPEGDAWEHTKLVVDMAAIFKSNLPEDWQLAYMYGALLHDVGKPSTTADDLTAYGHDTAGGPLAESFMRRITNDVKLIERVVGITVLHMRAGELQRSDCKKNAWMRLHNKMRLDVLAYMSKADSLSRYGDPDMEHLPSQMALNFFKEFGTAEKIPAVVMGRHLIDRGMKPGPEFGKVLKTAYDVQIDQQLNDVDEILKIVLS